MNKRIVGYIQVLVLLLLVGCGSSGPKLSENKSKQENLDALTSWLVALHQQGKFSGVVMYAQHGEVKYQQSLGRADLQGNKPLTLDSSFNLASVSKQFTASAIMLLKQDGKLDYDQPVTTYLPEFPYKQITVRHLLNHTSGLANYMAMAIESKWDESKTYAIDDMLAQFVQSPPKLDFTPGKKFSYSNTGYVLLAAIVERISNMSFEAFLAKRIFQPLQMQHSRVFNLLSAESTFESRAFGKDGDRLNDLIFLDGVAGDGAVYASANDLLKWDRAIYENKIISKALQDEAFHSVVHINKQLDYGFGWVISKDKDYIRHSGQWVGFRTLLKRNLTDQSLIVVLSNNNADKEYVNAIKDSLETIFSN